MIYKPFQNIKLSRLGMGNMRLPSDNPKDPSAKINFPEAKKVITRAYESGINYFDTAYVYNDGESEVCLGEAMKDFPRDSFYLATKYFVQANPDYEAVFEEQKKRLQTDRIDFYLIHCVTGENIDDYLTNGCIDYFLKKKEAGEIRYLGFSHHGTTETLTRFADHHKWDFAQLQLNYYDWNYGIAAKEYKILDERYIPIVVMEPVRGGRLSHLTDECDAMLKAAHPDWSISSWAMRFVKSKPQVQVILSGMSDLSQVDDNVKTFETEEALSSDDMKLLMEVCEKFKGQIQVPCTSCRYCTSGCPVEINIPEYLNAYNAYKVDGEWALAGISGIESKGKPSDCIGCGACTSHCPQSIDTPSIMRELAAMGY